MKEYNLLQELGSLFDWLAKKRDLNYTQVAKRVNLNRETVRKIRQGRNSHTKYLAKMFELYEIRSLDDLRNALHEKKYHH